MIRDKCVGKSGVKVFCWLLPERSHLLMRHRLLSAALMLLFCVFSSLAQPVTTGDSATVSDKLRMAEDLLNQSRAEEAVATFRAALDLAANRPTELRNARFAFARALSRINRYEEAIEQYQLLLRDSNDRDPIVYFNLGNLQTRLGQNEKAVESYRKAIEQRYGRYARAWNNLGIVLVRLGRYDEAREAYLKAIAEERGVFADARYNLAQLYWQQGDVKNAEAEISSALRLSPDNEDIKKLAEQIRYGGATGNSTAAVIVARSAVKSKDDANNPRLVVVSDEIFKFLQQARSARDRGEYAQSLTLYQSAMKSDKPVMAIEYEMAEVLLRAEKAVEAEAAFRHVIAEAGDRFPMAYLQAGNAMLKQQKFGAAVVMLRQALARVGDKPEIYIALSEALTKTDDIDGAVAILEKLSRLESASTENKAWSQRRIAELQTHKK